MFLLKKFSFNSALLRKKQCRSTQIVDAEDLTTAHGSKSSSRFSSVSSTPHRRFSLDSQGSSHTQSLDSSLLSSLTTSKASSLPILHSCDHTFNQFKCIMSLEGDNHGFPIALAGEQIIYSSSGTSDHTQVRMMHCSDFSTLASFAKSDAPVKALLVHGDTIFTAHHDFKIRMWKIDQQQAKKHKLVATLPSVQDCIVTSILPKSHVRTRRHKRQLKIQHYDAISVLAISAAADILYSGSWDKTVKVWRLSDFKCIDSFEAHSDAVNALAASRDGHLYTGSTDCKVKVWERGLNNKHLLTATFHKHQSGVNDLVLSSDEAFLFSASGDKSIIVWEREDSADHVTVSGILRGHQLAVLCLVTTNDVLCSGSADKTIRIWKRLQDSSQHCCLAVLEGHRGPVKSLSVSASFTECHVYSSSLDGNLRAWWVSLASRNEDVSEKGSIYANASLSHSV